MSFFFFFKEEIFHILYILILKMSAKVQDRGHFDMINTSFGSCGTPVLSTAHHNVSWPLRDTKWYSFHSRKQHKKNLTN